MCDRCGCGETGTSDGLIPVQEDVLAHDRAHAEALRQRLADLDGKLVNIIGGPGCGKTALVTALIPRLNEGRHCVVVVGDLATENDAERIRSTGVDVAQIQTGTVCHLTAHDVAHAIDGLSLKEGTLVLVENVGNLVCPSMFRLGESLRLACLSVTEGTDKPQKYPVTFRDADVAVITKRDLLPHVDFDLEACLRMIDEIRPGMPCAVTSARDGSGLNQLARHVSDLWGAGERTVRKP